MEITNEIKAKVFAQYLGQKAKCIFSDNSGEYAGRIECVSLEKEGVIFVVDNFSVGNWSGRMPDEIKLILKPLSSILDEDAIGVAKITNNVAMSVNGNINNGHLICDFLLGKRYNIGTDTYLGGDETINAYQFLQSKGYDLPHYLLGGKTLHEAGLAIYE